MRLVHGAEEPVHGIAARAVQAETPSLPQRRSQGVGEPQHFPVAGRDLPGKPSVANIRGQVDKGRAIDLPSGSTRPATVAM